MIRRPPEKGRSAAAPPPTPSQKRTIERRARVHYLVLTEGLTAPAIAARLDCSATTVKADIRALTEDSRFWLDAETRAGWGVQVQHMVTTAFADIGRLSAMAAYIERDEKRMDNEDPPAPDPNPYDPKTEARSYLEYQRNEVQMEMARNSRRHHFGEYATIMNAIARQRSLIKDFMDDLPMYRKVQELQLWVEQHETLRTDAPPDGTPETSLPALDAPPDPGTNEH